MNQPKKKLKDKLKDKLNVPSELLKKLYILFITILAPFIAKWLSTLLGEGENKYISAEVWFSGWMSYTAIIASIILVYWQIDTNNKIRREDEKKRYDEKDKEENDKRLKIETNINKYFSYCFAKNKKKYTWKDSSINDWGVINYLITEIKTTEKMGYEDLFYEVEWEYLNNKVDNLISMDNGIEMIEINDSIRRVNRISKKLKHNFFIKDQLKDLEILWNFQRTDANKLDEQFIAMAIHLLSLVRISLETKIRDEKSFNYIAKPVFEIIQNKISDKQPEAKEMHSEFSYLLRELLNYDSISKTGIPYINQLRAIYKILSNCRNHTTDKIFNDSTVKELFKEIELEIQLVSEFNDIIIPLLRNLEDY